MTFIYLLFQPRVLQSRWGLSQNDLLFQPRVLQSRWGLSQNDNVRLSPCRGECRECIWEERMCIFVYPLSWIAKCICNCMSILKSICIVLLLSLKCIFIFALHLLEIALWKKERHPKNLFHVSHEPLAPGPYTSRPQYTSSFEVWWLPPWQEKFEVLARFILAERFPLIWLGGTQRQVGHERDARDYTRSVRSVDRSVGPSDGPMVHHPRI
jgi:hypothetical protein